MPFHLFGVVGLLSLFDLRVGDFRGCGTARTAEPPCYPAQEGKQSGRGKDAQEDKTCSKPALAMVYLLAPKDP
jgi:hypothetical protein